MTGAHVVMVVDDDEGIRASLGEVFADEGYRVLAASNGREALELLRKSATEQPCLIFLDLMMPTMDGWRFREEQLADPRLASIPVVVITASRAVTPPAAQVVLPKPLQLDEVLGALATYC